MPFRMIRKPKLFVVSFFVFSSLIPVQYKPSLNLVNGISLYSKVGIAPIPKFLIQAKILIAYIKSTNISNFSVNNTKFAMVSIVNSEIHQSKLGRKENLHFSAC